MPLTISETYISDLYLIESDQISDSRGNFFRLFCQEELSLILQGRNIRQINYSTTQSVGAIRGLHFQSKPFVEMKLVRCMKGKIWDVVLDLRFNSPTFLQWHAEELTSLNNKMLVVPEGCAHGFQVLSPDSELLYIHTEFYNPNHEDGVRYNDPRLKIPWPLASTDISERDLNHPLIKADFRGIKI